MGMSMSKRIYPLSDGDEDEIKVWYPLNLGMRMEMNFCKGMGMR